MITPIDLAKTRGIRKNSSTLTNISSQGYGIWNMRKVLMVMNHARIVVKNTLIFWPGVN